MATRNDAAIARRYAEAVVGGDIAACKWVRLACQRQLDDLARFKGRNPPYRFNPRLTDKQGRYRKDREISAPGLRVLQCFSDPPEKPGHGQRGQTPEAFDRLPDDGTQGHPQNP